LAPKTAHLIEIKFQNKKTYFTFHEEFIDVIKKYFKEKIDDYDILDDPQSKRLCFTEKSVKKSEKFLIDTTPCSKISKSTSDESTPKYTSLSGNVLTNEKQQGDKKSGSRSMMANKCFNCDEDTHALRDCPKPRNMTKIRKARNDFSRKELRYHDDENDYETMVPGVLSEDLKTALGLVSNQIPLHVYKMRLFGYPPGWIEESKIEHSGLSLFAEKDNEHSKTDENNCDNFKYDLQKIFDYPGFNVPPESPFVDKYRLLNVPPMLPQHSKEEMIRSLGHCVVNGYKKRKLRDLNESADVTIVSEQDMDIDDEDDGYDKTLPPGVDSFCRPPLPLSSENFDEKPPSPEEGELSNESLVRNTSPSIEELNNQRNELLNEIGTSVNNKIFDDDMSNGEYGHVATTLYGTPVIPSFTPFDKLPEGNAFQEGVCDVIAFENLAESTGKYEKMKGLIRKVRQFVHENQKE
jgi:zinc finger CCHC domain-containing protein 8